MRRSPGEQENPTNSIRVNHPAQVIHRMHFATAMIARSMMVRETESRISGGQGVAWLNGHCMSMHSGGKKEKAWR